MKFERFNKFTRHEQGLHLASALMRADFWLKAENQNGVKLCLKESYEILDFMEKSDVWSEISYMPKGFSDELKLKENSKDINRFKIMADSI